MVLLTMVLTKYALIHSFIKKSYLSDFEFSILALSVLLITASGYVINDIYDIEADKINKPEKIFIDVSISKNNACKYYFLLTFLGISIGVYLSLKKQFPINSLYFTLTAIGLFSYSKYLKTKLLAGNFIVGFLIFLVIILVFDFEYIRDYNGHDFVYFLNLKNTNSLGFISTAFIYGLFSFIATLIREIIKDIEDINGDLKIKAKTLPIVIGRKRASKVAFFFTCILLIFLLIVLQLLIKEYIFLGYGIFFILLPLLYFMYKLWFAETKKDFSKLSSLMKVIMLFGILSMLLFKFI